MRPRRRPSSIRRSWPNGCADCAAGSTSSGGVFDVDSLRARLGELQDDSARPELWEDRERAEKVLREKSRVERELSFFDGLANTLEEGEVLLELAAEADDRDTWGEAAEKID